MNCGYGNLEDELRIACGTNSKDMRQRLLRIDDYHFRRPVDAESRKSANYVAETEKCLIWGTIESSVQQM